MQKVPSSANMTAVIVPKKKFQFFFIFYQRRPQQALPESGGSPRGAEMGF